MFDLETLIGPTAAVIGAFVGNFLTAAIHRYPALLDAELKAEYEALIRAGGPTEDGVVEPAADELPAEPGPPGYVAPARCARCDHPLGALETLPVVGYVLRRGRCGHCGGTIPVYMPLVEVLTAVGFFLVVQRYGASPQSLLGVSGVSLLVLLSGIDLRTRLLPDRLSLPGLWAGLLASTVGVFTDPTSAIIGAATGYVVPWAVHGVFRRLTGAHGMGHGDFKLVAMLGAWFGWQLLPTVFVIAFGVGGIWAAALLVSHRRQRGEAMPFGPFIAAAGGVVLTIGVPPGLG